MDDGHTPAVRAHARPTRPPTAAPCLLQSVPGIALMAELFEHRPDAAFFVKDRDGRYVAVNQSLVERVGFRERKGLLGRHVREVFPADLAERYAAQDAAVLRTGRPVRDRLELHWYPHRQKGWWSKRVSIAAADRLPRCSCNPER